MSVEEESVGDVTLYLCEDERRVTLILDDLYGESLYVETQHPVFDVIGCSLQFAIRVPLRIEDP